MGGIPVDRSKPGGLIKDLLSQRTIIRGIFIGWSSLFIILIIVNPSLILFIVLSGIAAKDKFLYQ